MQEITTRGPTAVENPFIGHVTRTVEECVYSIRAHVSNIAGDYIGVGVDLMEIKAQSEHGQWMKTLAELGFSQASADNYMKVAREYGLTGSPLAALPYSKALALTALPAGEREAFAQEIGADDKSAREIARLIREKQSLEKELERKSQDAEQWQKYYKDEHSRASQLRLDLDKAKFQKTQIVEKIVETEPEDYRDLKTSVEELAESAREAEQAAMDAEARARELEDEVARLRREAQERDEDETADGISAFLDAVNAFMSAVQPLPWHPEVFKTEDDRRRCRMYTGTLLSWGQEMLRALDAADHVPGEAVVV